jgi:hypothetical protein
VSAMDMYDLMQLRREMREQDKRRWQDPDFPRGAEFVPIVWVAYTWNEPGARWEVRGFVSTKRLRLPTLVKIRTRLKIEPEAIMLLQELFHSSRVGGPSGPPVRSNPLLKERKP